MIKIKFLYILTAVSLLAVSCTKNFDAINDDPNRPKQVTPGVMLPQMQYRIVNSSTNAGRAFTHELMQVDAPRTSTGGGGLHRYIVNPGAGVWNNFYNYLNDIQDIYKIADSLKENNYKGIALVYKAWAYSILTDLYGDVPFSQASKGGEGKFQAAFDKQQDIYTQILKDLDTANVLFNDSKALTYGGDLVYASNALTASKNLGIQKWRKFSNSLKLRLLLRLSKRDAEMNITAQINTLLADPARYPVFTSNSDEAILRYPGTNPYYNPYYNARPSDWSEGNYFTNFFLNKMIADNDPRRTVWCTTVLVSGVPTYRGIESGYPISKEYVTNQNSSYNDGLKTLPQLGVMMTYAEVEFIKAELSLKGFATGKTPKQHYENGVTASIIQWGATMPEGFLQSTGILYNTANTTEKQLEQIILQKYYAYFFVDYQSWFEKRRTGYPVLPRGSGIPAENLFPARVPYPTTLQTLNAENLKLAVASMGGDNSNIKVWWDK